MTHSLAYTAPAGADTGAVLARTSSTELHLAYADPDATHLGTYLSARREPAHTRAARAWTAALAAARREWLHREPPVPAARASGPATLSA
jgi:hypothetical protein